MISTQLLTYYFVEFFPNFFISIHFQIKINIADQNDNSPELDGDSTLQIFEDYNNSDETQDGDTIFTFEPTDNDRDGKILISIRILVILR